MNLLFLSNRLDVLVDRLCQQFEDEPLESMKSRAILVPNRSIRDWLLLEIAKKRGIAICVKVMEPEVFFQGSMSASELFCSIYSELEQCRDPQLISYLEGKKSRQIRLAKELSQLFPKYGEHDKELVESQNPGFQHEILRKVFPREKKLTPIQKQVVIEEEIFCFGINYLPPVYWNALFSSPKLSIYLFSPCFFYWEDVSSDWEIKSLNRYWKRRGAKEENLDLLDTYLREPPRNLANWGKLGRETLKILDQYEVHTEELHTTIEPKSLLQQIQFDLLNFKETEKIKIDDSIKIFLTGSSKLREVEILREQILKTGFDYRDIHVLAPDIEPYVPLIEYVFSDDIPYRISGFDILPKSSFMQGLLRFLSVLHGRWDVEILLTLFETPSFYRKFGWDTDTLLTIRSWVEYAHIQWGINAKHRQKTLEETFGNQIYEDFGSWERGFDALLETLIYEKEIEVEANLFETLIFIIEAFKDLCVNEMKTLLEWAEFIEKMALEFLSLDPNDEADVIAQTAFQQLLKDLKKIESTGSFPIEVIEDLLMRPHYGQIHSSYLHAVRFSPFHSGVMPAKAIFLIGMDEESFPTKSTETSLDLLKKVPDQRDCDRYLFLEALFSSIELLRISFGHLSEDEGKPVGPSILVQDLLNVIGPDVLEECITPTPKFPKKHLFWPRRTQFSMPKGEYTLHITDLKKLARHSWDFYLQKVHEIYLDKTLEKTFALEKAKLLRQESFEEPIGIIGKALAIDVLERKEEFDELIQSWQVRPFTLNLRENVSSSGFVDETFVAPALEFQIDNCKVKLIGEVSQTTTKGVLYSGQDTIAGALKIWPEALISAVCLEAPNILMLKSGKMKSFSQPQKHLEAYLRYYFECLSAPSPLISDWADAFLRKGLSALEKVRVMGTTFEDPVYDWVIARAEMPSSEDLFLDWGPLFKETFSELATLYPVRGQNEEV